jgi:predicted nucleic acid-binding protein
LDLCVAAIAVRHRYVLITGNVRHFQGIPGLKVENWLSD